MAKRKNEILTAVEIGSHNIKVLLGEFQEDDVLSVVGSAEELSLKVQKGNLLDAGIVREQLMKALAAAEKQAGEEIGHVFLTVSGGTVKSLTSTGSAVIHSPEKRITEEDVITALENARAYTLSPDQMVLHHMDRRHLVDGGREVPNPVGQVGSRLESEIQVMYGRRNSIQTLCGLLNEVLGYPATDITFSGLSSGFGVLSTEEMESGAMIIDIGAGVTEYAVFHGAGVYQTGQVTVGTEHIVNDLSLGLHLPMPKSRALIRDLDKHGGSANVNSGNIGRYIEVEALGRETRRVPLASVEQIIELRLKELLEVIKKKVNSEAALTRVNEGIFLTGGGAMIPGINALAQRVFEVPVETGRPRLLSGQPDILTSPRYATVAGVLRWGQMSLQIADSGPLLREQLKDDFVRFLQALKQAFKW
ncbi:MAG: cell division protein FtsA [Verrucomicrobiota bacterium]